jgi:hypothetical protein
MAETNNVFISWSGERSKRVAEALREWLPNVLQAAKPWLSRSDIEKGARSLDEIGRALEAMKVGIICLTPENLTAEWILFESGALSKTQDAQTRVCTYLLFGLTHGNVRPPLGMFHGTTADKEDTRKLIHTINKHLDATVTDERLDKTFEKWWPDLAEKLETASKAAETVAPKRSSDEMLAEILEFTRAMTPQILGLVRDTELERRTREFLTGAAATWNTVSAAMNPTPVRGFRDISRSLAQDAAAHNAAAPNSGGTSNAAFYGEDGKEALAENTADSKAPDQKNKKGPRIARGPGDK